MGGVPPSLSGLSARVGHASARGLSTASPRPALCLRGVLRDVDLALRRGRDARRQEPDVRHDVIVQRQVGEVDVAGCQLP